MHYFFEKMENLTVPLRMRLRKTLSRQYSQIPDEFISDAITDAYTAFLMKAPAEIAECPPKKYRWLLTVASRRLIIEHKRLSHYVRQDDLHYDPFQDETEISFDNEETVHALIEGLAPVLKQTAVLHFLQEFSYEEVSEQLHVNLETVKKRCKRAISQMKIDREK